MANGNVKKPVHIGNYVTDGDQRAIVSDLKTHVEPVLGELNITWTGRTPNNRPAFSTNGVPPDKVGPLREALIKVFGVICNVDLADTSVPA